MKYFIQEKLKIVKEHLEVGVPLHELAKKYNYHYTNIKYQCALYRMYVEKAFEDHGTSRTYGLQIIKKAGVNNPQSK